MECHYSQKLAMRKLAHSNSGSRQHYRTFLLSPTMALLWTLFFSSFVFSIHGCNIDTTRPVFYTPPTVDSGAGEDYSDGLFGYTVLQHKASTNEYVLVGAPTANSYYLDFGKREGELIEKPGVLFRCRARSPQTCFEINLDESANTKPVLPGFQHKKQNAWIGASLTRQPTKLGDQSDELSDITVCGPRYANDYYTQYASDSLNTTFDPNERFLNGICYSFGHDRNGDVPIDNVGLVKSSIPCEGYNQTDEVNTYIHGLCQAGMSAQYTSDGNSIMLGAIGSYNWTGTVFEGDKEDLDFRPLADVWGEDYDYFGYAVTSGNFVSKETVQGVTSAPRAIRKQKEMTTGKVIIYDLDTQEVYQELYGESNGSFISWTSIEDLYKEDVKMDGLYLNKKLSYEHVNLTSYSKMKVSMAAQVLSTTVADSLELYQGPAVQHTVEFVRMFDKFFDLLNIRSRREYYVKRKDNLKQYEDPDDPRLKWLEEDFVQYLDEWRNKVETEKSQLTRTEKNKMLIPNETLSGLYRTARGFPQLARFLLQQPGVEFLLSERINQDPLESFFGNQRQMKGGNEAPTAAQMGASVNAARVKSSLQLKNFGGNTKQFVTDITIDETPLPKRRRLSKH